MQEKLNFFESGNPRGCRQEEGGGNESESPKRILTRRSFFSSEDRKRVITLLANCKYYEFPRVVKRRLAQMANYLEKREFLTAKEWHYIRKLERDYPPMRF